MTSGVCGSATTERVPRPGLTGKSPVSVCSSQETVRPVDVDENAHRVHGLRRGPTACEGGSRDLDVEGKGPEVRRDSEPDDVHVRVEHATRSHRFRGHRGPVVELTVDLNRIGGTVVGGNEE